MLVVCDYLGDLVEMPDERAYAILSRWPEVASKYHSKIVDTIFDPDEVRIDTQVVYGDSHVLTGKIYFVCRWFDELNEGSFVVVAICEGGPRKYRYITSFLSHELTKGEHQWRRS
jgi:hypothetical protein